MSFLERNNISYKHFNSSIRTASGFKQEVIGFCTLPVVFKGVEKNIDFYLVPSLSQDAYFGINFWRDFALAPEIIPAFSNNISEILHNSELDDNFHNLSAEQKLDLERTILEFPSFEILGLGSTDLLEHHIDTGDATPIKCRIGCLVWALSRNRTPPGAPLQS